jgi:hypothetical protein
MSWKIDRLSQPPATYLLSADAGFIMKCNTFPPLPSFRDLHQNLCVVPSAFGDLQGHTTPIGSRISAVS